MAVVVSTSGGCSAPGGNKSNDKKRKRFGKRKVVKMKMMIEIMVTVIMIMVAVVAVVVMLVAVAVILKGVNSLDFLLEHLPNVKVMFKNLLSVFVSMQRFIKMMFLTECF